MDAPDPQQDEFANMVIQRLREVGVSDEISYDAEEFQITVGGDTKSTLFLNNAYREYCSLSKKHRPQAVLRFVRGWLQAHKPTPEEYADIQPDILPAVRSRSFYEAARLRMMIEETVDTYLAHQVLGDDLGLGLVYDMPDSMRPITDKELEGWGLTLYEALEAARDNLRQLRPVIIGPKEGEGTYVFATNDGYDSTRLILLDLIRQFQVKGDYIALAPGREMLIVVGSEDEPGLKAMVELAKKALNQPRTVSGVALRLDGDEWTPWMPAADHPLFDEFRLLRMKTCGQDYAEQKELLETLHAKRGEDVFVSPFSVLQRKDTGHRTSYCLWAGGGTSLLPHTERVVLGGEGRETIMAAWEKVVEAAGDLMMPMDVYPERYRVEEFPTEEQLRAMGNELKE